ncbi:MAG: hypothetical protein IT204_11015 [Fimbriimonadaceae bacterium]|nr:hypothetical protein [Fimbriimonadaceae bacterium]
MRKQPLAPSGWPVGSIGDLSSQVGEDVRDLILEGFTWDQLHEVAAGRTTLAALRRQQAAERAPAQE